MALVGMGLGVRSPVFCRGSDDSSNLAFGVTRAVSHASLEKSGDHALRYEPAGPVARHLAHHPPPLPPRRRGRVRLSSPL